MIATTRFGRSTVSSRQRITAPLDRSHPCRAARRTMSGPLRSSRRAQLLQKRPAEALLGLLLRVLDRKLRHRRGRGDPQELAGVESRLRLRREQHDHTDDVVPQADRRLRDDVDRDRRGPAVDAPRYPCLERLQVDPCKRPVRGQRDPRPRDHDGDGAADGCGRQLSDALDAVTVEHGVHHRRVGIAQRRGEPGLRRRTGERGRDSCPCTLHERIVHRPTGGLIGPVAKIVASPFGQSASGRRPAGRRSSTSQRARDDPRS